MARQKDTPFEIEFQKLQERWKCQKHQYCYREQYLGKEQHYSFPAKNWAEWTTLILANKALPDHPPRNPEFNALLLHLRNNHSRSNTSKKSKHGDDSSDSDEKHKGIKIINMTAHPYHDFVLPRSNYSRRYSDPSPRKPSNKKNIIETLEDIGYAPAEWIGKGLNDYFTWLSNKYGGLDLQQALTAVKSQDIGLDVLGMESVDVQFLTTNCGISSGLGLRIVNNFNPWLNEKLTEARNE